MSSPSPMSQFCVGTLVASKYVLTSAQCVHGKSASSLHLMIGDHELDEVDESVMETNLDVSRIVVNEDFRPISKTHDIALLELTEHVDLAVYTPACLIAEEEVPGDQAQLTGWDATTFKLTTVAAQVMDKPQCSVEDFICAGAINSSLDSGACKVTILRLKRQYHAS